MAAAPVPAVQAVVVEIGEADAVLQGVERAEIPWRVRSRAAGVFPFVFRRQRAFAADFGGKPLAEGLRVIPRDADDRLLRTVDRFAAGDTILPACVHEGAVVVRFEQFVLLVRDFELA